MPDAIRFDFLRIDGKPRITQQGFLRVDGNLTRTGVLTYKRADGSEVRELREPTEVFKNDSLEGLKRAPLTDMHTGMITPDNVGDLQVGFVEENVAKNGGFVSGTLTVQRRDMIDKIQAGQRTELSPGYTVDIDPTPGEYNGERYDAIQRNIVYNHVAIGPDGWGRSGGSVALRMDGGDLDVGVCREDGINDRELLSADQLQKVSDNFGISIDAMLEVMPEKDREKVLDSGDPEKHKWVGIWRARAKSGAWTPPKGGAVAKSIEKQKKRKDGFEMKKVRITLDGITYEIEVPDNQVTAFEAGFAKLEKERKDAADKASKLEGELDAAKKEVKETKEKLDAADKPETLDAAVNARVKLIDDARKLDAEIKCDGKNAKTIKLEALAKAGYESNKFDGKDDAYIDGVFEATVDRAGDNASVAPAIGAPPSPAPRTDAAGDGEKPVTREDASEATTKAARDRMLARNREAWQKPLSASK